MSRADLARALDITRSTASSIVANLVADGRVTELAAPDPEEAPQRTGRPGIRVALNTGRFRPKQGLASTRPGQLARV